MIGEFDGALPTGEKVQAECLKLVRRYEVRAGALTEQQVAGALFQAIACGDFNRCIEPVGGGQGVVYIPYREVERWKGLYHELLMAVETVYPGETRHETAMRYIKEREGAKCCPDQVAVQEKGEE